MIREGSYHHYHRTKDRTLGVCVCVMSDCFLLGPRGSVHLCNFVVRKCLCGCVGVGMFLYLCVSLRVYVWVHVWVEGEKEEGGGEGGGCGG